MTTTTTDGSPAPRVPGSDPLRIALVGAGFIAESHLRAIQNLRGAEVVAICDPSEARAGRLARAFGVRRTFRSLAELIASGEAVDAAHVLVPPDWHAELAAEALKAGLHTFVEKPLALDAATCRELGQLAAERGLCLAVNHNMVFMPVWQRLRREIDGRGTGGSRFGRVEHIQILHHVGLRQLAMREYEHFVFDTPANILLEQGVHLFSLVEDTVGRCRSVRAHTVGRSLELPGGGTFHDTWSVTLSCERGTAEVFLAFGRPMPEVFAHVVGADAAARVDLLRGTYVRVGKSAALEAIDHGGGAVGAGLALVRQGIGTVGTYVTNLLRLGRRGGDPFARSMYAGIGDFVESVREGRKPRHDVESAAAVLEMCERTASAAGVSFERRPRTAPLPDAGEPRPGEVVVTGGTGFVGSALLPELLEYGHKVTMLVRRPSALAPELRGDERVRFVQGDAADPEALRAAFRGARCVLHLATCAGPDPDKADEAMAAAARTVAEACRDSGVERLVFVSSTAALYLGGDPDPVSGDSGPDPHPEQRPVYSRGKILAERALAEFAAAHNDRAAPEIVVLRPAIVVGPGGNAQHTGVGLWPSDTHCVGWGSGGQPLPFLLVADCASALRRAVEAEGIGGRSFNLAGDVRWTAERYIEAMRAATGRAFRFHPRPLWWFWTVEAAKYLLKRAVRRPAIYTSWRDFRSRAFLAKLDCEDAKAALGWRPVAEAAEFEDRAVRVHAPAGSVPAANAR